jgi:hypothetical protein
MNDTASTLEPIHVSNCPVCNAFPVQHIAAPGDAIAFKFLSPRNVKALPVPAAANDAVTLEWSDTLCKGERINFAKAEKACTALGEGWRMPTRMELESILDLTRHDPAVDIERFPDTKSGWYWSSTPCAWDSSVAWIVHFHGGYAYSSHRGDGYAFVRAVRSLPAGQ